MTLVLTAAGCQSARPPVAGRTSGNHSPSLAPGGHPPHEVSADEFDPGDFSHASTIDNGWFPLTPGTQLIFEGRITADGERLSHRVVFTVTDLTKTIEGVRALVVWDRDYSSGTLEESELALFAQDDDGNVWHLGEYPEEYEGRRVVEAPAWVHGIAGATAGIAMRASPRLGSSDYAQGFAPPPVDWADRGRVYRVDEETCVPAGCYSGVLVTEEFELDKPKAFQLKYYARGVGNVRVGWRGANEDERETLVLVRIVHLGPEAMSEVREQVRKQDARGHRISGDVWGLTPPVTT